jgi:hypothetical protein
VNQKQLTEQTVQNQAMKIPSSSSSLPLSLFFMYATDMQNDSLDYGIRLINK